MSYSLISLVFLVVSFINMKFFFLTYDSLLGEKVIEKLWVGFTTTALHISFAEVQEWTSIILIDSEVLFLG